jgi:hypothetical protein
MAWSVVILAAGVLLWLVLVLAFLYGVYAFLRWLWGRVPRAAISVTPDQSVRLLALLLSLALFPSLITYAWNTAQALLNLVSQVIVESTSNVSIPRECLGLYPRTEETIDCASKMTVSVNKVLSMGSVGLVKALRLDKFPADDFVRFLIAVVVSTLVIRTIYERVSFERIASWYARARGAIVIPGRFWQQLAFTALVLVSFYLGLSALLAIPLFQDKSRPLQLTADELLKALDANIMKPDLFQKTFPAEPPAFAEVRLNVQSAGPITLVYADFFKLQYDNQKERWQELVGRWRTVRETAETGPTLWRDQAMGAFKGGLEASTGKKQTVQHYNDLFTWHQSQSQQAKAALSQCQGKIGLFNTSASQYAETTRAFVEKVAQDEAAKDRPADSRVPALPQTPDGLFNSFDDAVRSCSLDYREAMPQRLSFASALGPIGHWTGWVLDPEQMPVVIIVGLVGFSLLGATVSRAVRAGDKDLKAALTLDDLLVVVAVGMTAAVVVFLAAYGGLAILGSSAADPNPYIVFVTCLIAAVYSEDVWGWARVQVLKARLKRDEEVPPQAGGRAGTTGVQPQDGKKTT